MRKIQIALVCFGLVALSHGFELMEVKPKNESVNEGKDVILSCKTDSNWRWCTFIHKVDFRKLEKRPHGSKQVFQRKVFTVNWTNIF